MEQLMENEAFCIGVNVGIHIFQQKVLTAHKQREGLKIGDNLYYIQSGRERLQEVLEKICK
ncbi:hypothetical protein AALB52_23255 [Lachnospiraceae bacterium 38-14]|uniref:hypothetical protein n=1 Tax=Roseburia sp. 1XD42-69 TaxID=2320088 RepID=UPI000EA132BF|nr:hypothetical protein [Roseburia sp. 1XD42-69]RKJ60013.1 hypothetical protein D7Y06_25025 [Roseburia sp. 1XD42-69]